jgi:L-rhamnose-H+ transport protein
MLTGLVLIPWIVVLLFVPHPLEAYRQVGWGPIILANIWAIAWGIANVLYGICVLRIGAALTGALLSGLGLSVGAILPMIFKGSGLFGQAADLASKTGLVIGLGVIVILIGIGFCSAAGFGREKALKKNDAQNSKVQGSFLTGLIMVIVAGIASAGIGLTFVYGQGPIVNAVKAQGAGDVVANVAVWAIALLGGALVNLLFPAYLITKNHSWKALAGSGKDAALAAILGTQFIIGIMMLGRGMLLLGTLGASIGFGIQQAMQIMGNQGVGFISGECDGITGLPRLRMYISIAILILGVVILALANNI